MDASGAMSRSLPILPTPLEEKYPKLPDSPQVTLAQELISNTISSRTATLSTNQTAGNFFFSSAGCPSPKDIQPSCMSLQTSQLKISPFISKSLNDGASFASNQPPHALKRSRPLNDYITENNNISRSTDATENSLDLCTNAPGQNVQVETCTGVIASENLTKGTDWQEWADQSWLVIHWAQIGVISLLMSIF